MWIVLSWVKYSPNKKNLHQIHIFTLTFRAPLGMKRTKEQYSDIDLTIARSHK